MSRCPRHGSDGSLKPKWYTRWACNAMAIVSRCTWQLGYDDIHYLYAIREIKGDIVLACRPNMYLTRDIINSKLNPWRRDYDEVRLRWWLVVSSRPAPCYLHFSFSIRSFCASMCGVIHVQPSPVAGRKEGKPSQSQSWSTAGPF